MTLQNTQGRNVGQFYGGYYGEIYEPGGRLGCIDTGVTYGEGDTITVAVDHDASTVAFAKNDAAVPKSTVSIAPHEAHYFAFNAGERGNAVTITWFV